MPTDFVQLIFTFFMTVKLYLFEPVVCLHISLLLLSSMREALIKRCGHMSL